MLVPEASMNENHLLSGAKHDIRFSRKIFGMQAEAIATMMEELAQANLG
jgi:hypothetical protein